jgi:hypothetical protein
MAPEATSTLYQALQPHNNLDLGPTGMKEGSISTLFRAGPCVRNFWRVQSPHNGALKMMPSQ